jgi:hypothetical protein
MKLTSLLSLLPLVAALPGHGELGGRSLETQMSKNEVRTSNTGFELPSLAPRLVMYVQTFTMADNQPLSLLPLLKHDTKVTHVILAAIHLLTEPGNITLNDDSFDASRYDTVWEELQTLQDNGIKVMALLGGAAAGSYARLNGTDAEVFLPSPRPKF